MINVNPSGWHTGVLGYCTQSHSYAELVSSRASQSPLGVCLNDKCIAPIWSCFRSKNKFYIHRYTTFNSMAFNCSLCNHALYWVKPWIKITQEGFHAISAMGLKNKEFGRIYYGGYR